MLFKLTDKTVGMFDSDIKAEICRDNMHNIVGFVTTKGVELLHPLRTTVKTVHFNHRLYDKLVGASFTDQRAKNFLRAGLWFDGVFLVEYDKHDLVSRETLKGE